MLYESGQCIRTYLSFLVISYQIPSISISYQSTYLSTDFFGTRQIIFSNENAGALARPPATCPPCQYQVRGQKVRKPRGGQNLMHFYSIYVVAEYILSGSEIICRQILPVRNDCTVTKIGHPFRIMMGNDWPFFLDLV